MRAVRVVVLIFRGTSQQHTYAARSKRSTDPFAVTTFYEYHDRLQALSDTILLALILSRQL